MKSAATHMSNRGRNKDLITARNKKLIERYYYWTEIKRRRFDDVIKILSEQEFFISEYCVLGIIRKAAMQNELNLCARRRILPVSTPQLSLFEQ